MLPGDLIRHLLDRQAEASPLDERERGSLDPQTIAEFQAHDVPFRTPPSQGFVFPPEPNDD